MKGAAFFSQRFTRLRSMWVFFFFFFFLGSKTKWIKGNELCWLASSLFVFRDAYPQLPYLFSKCLWSLGPAHQSNYDSLIKSKHWNLAPDFGEGG